MRAFKTAVALCGYKGSEELTRRAQKRGDTTGRSPLSIKVATHSDSLTMLPERHFLVFEALT
jgi:hypothetical protein